MILGTVVVNGSNVGAVKVEFDTRMYKPEQIVLVTVEGGYHVRVSVD